MAGKCSHALRLASALQYGASRQRELATGEPHSRIIPEKPGNVNCFAGKGVGAQDNFSWRGRLTAPAEGPREPEYAGVRCSVCKNELFRGEEYGADGERVLCAGCARDEIMGLSDGEVLELMGLEVRRG